MDTLKGRYVTVEGEHREGKMASSIVSPLACMMPCSNGRSTRMRLTKNPGFITVVLNLHDGRADMQAVIK